MSHKEPIKDVPFRLMKVALAVFIAAANQAKTTEAKIKAEKEKYDTEKARLTQLIGDLDEFGFFHEFGQRRVLNHAETAMDYVVWGQEWDRLVQRSVPVEKRVEWVLKRRKMGTCAPWLEMLLKPLVDEFSGNGSC